MNEKLFPDFGKTSLRPNEVLLSIDIPYSKPVRHAALMHPHTLHIKPMLIFSDNCTK